MSALEQAHRRLLALAERADASRAAQPAWLTGLRQEARERFREQGLPTTRLEEWRYTSLADLARVPFEAVPATAQAVTRRDVEAVAFPVFACSLYVFVDGRYDPRLSALAAGARVHAESLAELLHSAPERLESRLGCLADTKAHPFAALNTACLEDGAALLVPRGAVPDEPLHVVFLSTDSGAPRLRNPRLLVIAEEGSRVRIIQDHVSLGAEPDLTNATSEILVARSAQVDLVLLQREGPETFHVSHVAAHQERDSRFSCHTLCLGGRLVRNDLSVVLADEGAECTLHGLFVAGGEQVVDNHTIVDHAMPHGTSRELYKGILGGRSRGVFRGRVVVRPDAQRTNAEQSNPNLLLSEGAEIDTKPQLEIHADDVKCSHGSSIGQLDEDALFYLRSRGIDAAESRDVLTRGFAHEILDALPVEALADGLDEVLQARLDGLAGQEPGR